MSRNRSEWRCIVKGTEQQRKPAQTTRRSAKTSPVPRAKGKRYDEDIFLAGGRFPSRDLISGLNSFCKVHQAGERRERDLAYVSANLAAVTKGRGYIAGTSDQMVRGACLPR